MLQIKLSDGNESYGILRRNVLICCIMNRLLQKLSSFSALRQIVVLRDLADTTYICPQILMPIS
jgi:hypothetical protein